MQKPLRVLMVEDSEDDALLLIRELKKGGYEPEYERVEIAEAMSAALRQKSWDMILCDYQMPQFNGLAAIALLKETGIDIPLIIVSGAIGEETAVECMRLGAHDYIMKDKLARLVPAVERELKEAGSRRQRKQAEAELKESKALTEAVVENVPLMIFLKEATNLRFVIFNRAGEELLGYDRRDLMGKNNLDLFPPEQAAHFMAKDREVLDGEAGMLDIPEEPIQTAKKGERLLHTRKVCIRGTDGETKYLLGISEDITERKRAEEILKKSEEEFRSLAESMPQIVWVTRKDGWNIYFNQQWVDYTGLTLEESYGHGWNIPFHPEDQLRAMSAWENATKNNGIYSLECRLRRADGVYRWWLVRGVPLLDETGEIIKWFGTCTDIDGIKNAEKRLQGTLDSLKRAVNTTIQVMISAVEARDPYTAGHQIRSSNLACAIASEMGLPQEKIEGIRMAGSIHDIGKLSIPAEILSKPKKLTNIEFSIVKEHSLKGFEMLRDVESPWPLAEIVYQHHERMDGSGYPRNLKGEDILMEARILSVADVVEAMASHRPYRPGLGIDAALNEIEKNRGIFYDSAVADACLRLFREKGFKLGGA